MAEILSDTQIKNLLGKVIINADENLINPNSIELRLGNDVLFHSTDEELEIKEGNFLKILPGETLTFSSYETLDFTPATIHEIYPNERLMGLLTPTTTMMREGISQVTTKIDVGYYGVLNWALRNGSSKEIIIQHKEPLFKLTIFKLKGDEIPQFAYGERNNDTYQNTEGIKRSNRKIPANIPKSKIVQSNFANIDVKKELKEAGYPFNYIGTELTALHGKFEIVSKDVMLIKKEFNDKTIELTNKIDKETDTLKTKIETTGTNILDKSKVLFSEQFTKIAGVIIGAITLLYGTLGFLQQQKVDRTYIFTIAFIAGIVIITITAILTKKGKK